jgi:hypothetical protein
VPKIGSSSCSKSNWILQVPLNNTEYIFHKAYENYERLYLTPEMIEQRVEAIFAPV